MAIHTLPGTKKTFHMKTIDDGLFIRDLKQRDLHPVLTNIHTFRGEERGAVMIPEVIDGSLELTPEYIAQNGIRAMRNHILAPFIAEPGVPLLNSNKLKEFAASKARLNPLFGEFAIPTYVLPTQEDDFALALAILEEIKGEKVVIKPSVGHGGSDVKILQREDAISLLNTLFKTADPKEHIVQPFISGGKIPPGVRSHREADEQALQEAREKQYPSEIRFFVVKNGESLTIVSVLRISKMNSHNSEADDYVDVVLSDTHEEVLIPVVQDIVEEVSKKSGESERLIGAIDFTYNSGRFWVVEGNFRNPTIPRTNLNPYSGRRLFPAVADVISGMVEDNTSE